MNKLRKIRLNKKQKYYLSSVLFLAIVAIFLTWFIEYRYFSNSVNLTWDFYFGKTIIFFYNALLVFLLLGILWGVFRKPTTAAEAGWITLIILAYINTNKFASRGTPVLPEDFQLATEASALTKFVSPISIVRLISAIILVVLLARMINKLIAKRLNLYQERTGNTWWKRQAVWPRLATIAIFVLALYGATGCIRYRSGRTEQIPLLNTQFVAWNQAKNYETNGFILGFLYNFEKIKVEEPDNYSQDTIAAIKSEYTEKAASGNISRTKISDTDTSVIVILNESFFDPSVTFQGESFETYYPHTGGDILPNLHAIEASYPSGKMYSLDYGGGTANMEFEVFTSMTNYWVNTVPYTALIPKAGKIPTLVSMLKSANYKTTAIHPYNGGMYKRNIALPNEGFDTFITETEMKHTEHDGKSQYINDQSAYAEVLDTLESSDDTQMIGLITMQNHTPYNADTYDSTEFSVTNTDIDDAHRSQIATYYQSIHNSDQYLGDFIKSLDSLDKKVVVLYFGDHSAGIFDNTNNSSNKQVRDLSRITPYFIYANYDAGFKDMNLPTTTPNCLANTLLNELNWQKDAQYYMLDEVCSTEPILAPTYLDDRGASDAAVLTKYKLYTYDILSGKQYWKK